MIYSYMFNGLPVRTGDILCTADGQPDSLFGQMWRLFGLLVPGEVDHCILYVGPGGRCIESGVRGVIAFDMNGPNWDAEALFSERILLDNLVGVAYPLEGRALPSQKETRIRERVAAYCLKLAEANTPYNLNYFNPDTNSSFYCSQLVYQAYKKHGILLKRRTQAGNGRLLQRVVFPTEIWEVCAHRRSM